MREHGRNLPDVVCVIPNGGMMVILHPREFVTCLS